MQLKLPLQFYRYFFMLYATHSLLPISLEAIPVKKLSFKKGRKRPILAKGKQKGGFSYFGSKEMGYNTRYQRFASH